MFKKLFYKLMLLTLVGMLAAPFILKRENGTTIMSMDEFLDFDIEVIKQRYSQAIAVVREFLAEDMEVETFKEDPFDDKVTKLYKWKDENGEWHFSDTKDDKFQSEEVKIHNDRNVLKFEDLPKKEEKDKSKKKTESSKESDEKSNNNKDGGIIKGYLNNMKSTVDSAREVQSKVDTDFERKSAAIDG